MKSKKLAELPIPQSGCGSIRLVTDGLNLTLEFEYRQQSQDWIGSIGFEEIIAHRFRNEMHSKGYLSDSYESIAEVEDSPWKQELLAMTPTGIADVKKKRHFAVFLSSNGYVEVIASRFVVHESRRGTLE